MKVMFKMLQFVRPRALTYLFSTFIYTSSDFARAAIFSVFSGLMTTAVLDNNPSAAIKQGIIVLVGIMFYFVLLGFAMYNFAKTHMLFNRNIKGELFRSFVNTSAENKAGTGEGIASINQESDNAGECLFDRLSWLLFPLWGFVLSTITVFAMDWRLGITGIAVGIISLLIQTAFANPLNKLSMKQLGNAADTTQGVTDAIDGSAIIRTYSLQNMNLQSFDKKNISILLAGYRKSLINAVMIAISSVQNWIVLASTFGVGAYLLAKGEINVTVLVMMPPLVAEMTLSLAHIGYGWASLQEPLAAAKRVADMIDLNKEHNKIDAARKPTEWNGDYTLTLKGIDFSYKGAEDKTLSDITLTIEPNTFVAFVGESGCGKSTLMRLINGMYERGEQPITLGNLQMGVIPRKQWRQYFANVDQSCKLFNLTIAENIALGNVNTALSMEQIASAAREAEAYDFITELPDGFDTNCRKTPLSGGQRQRVAIARALARSAPILMLDEATSSLDAISEKGVMQTIHKLRRNHTILMISHNLKQVVDADTIVVIDKGRIAAIGNHEKLISSCKLYQKMWAE